MKLHLLNGYPFPYPKDLTPEQEESHADDASGITLDIDNVSHFEWVHTLTIEFTSMFAARTAVSQTGWAFYDESRLVLEAKVSSEDGYGHPAIVAGDKAYCGFILLPDDQP